LSDFTPTFESDPPRTDAEIVALLGGPLQTQIAESGLAGSAVMVSSDLISHFGILRPFEQSVRDLLRLDLFSIRTQMVQNVVLDKVLGAGDEAALSQQGQEPVQQDPLGRYFDNTTITLGKYIGTDLFLETMVRISERPGPGVDTEVILSFEWPTPFFDLEWNMSPSAPDLDTFLADNQISITWRYSY
jgi:hypothetical protein